MKCLIAGLLALTLAASGAHAVEQAGIDGYSIGPGNSLYSGGTARLNDIPASDGVMASRQWCFDATNNQTAQFTFPWIWDDNTDNKFQWVLVMAGQTIYDGRTARFGVTAVDITDGAIIDTVTGVEPVGLGITPSFTPTGFKATQTITNATPQVVWDAQANAPCSGQTCWNHLVQGRIQRINTNAVCADVGQPYICCTGAATGTCAPSSNYGGELCVQLVLPRF